RKSLHPDVVEGLRLFRSAMPTSATLVAAGAAAPWLAASACSAPFPSRALAGPRAGVLDALSSAAAALLDEWAVSTLERPLRAILSDFARTYEGLKRERGVLDFVDLEAKAAALLADH